LEEPSRRFNNPNPPKGKKDPKSPNFPGEPWDQWPCHFQSPIRSCNNLQLEDQWKILENEEFQDDPTKT